MTAFIVIVAAIWGLAYTRSSLPVWTGVMAAVLVLLGLAGALGAISFSICVAIYGTLAVALNVAAFRRNVITQPIFKLFKSILPEMTSTEREALEAGDTWWETDLFQGDPDWNKMLAIPKPQLTDEEQSFLDNETEQLCAMLDDFEIVQEDRDLKPEVWQFIKDNGFLGMIIPKEYGGKGFTALAHSSVVTKIATRSLSAAVNVMVPNSLGPGELLMHYGTDEQKDHYLPSLASGKDVPCFGLTAPDAGSDAGAIPDTGIVCKGDYNGEQVLGLKLNFNKRWITLAPVATVVGLAFKAYDPEGLLGDEEELGISVALVPHDHPGMKIGQRHFPLNMAFMNGPIQGEDVFIPLEFIIGGPDMLGQGWRMLVECLSVGRCISLPGLSTAISRSSYRLTGGYARIRKQFKTSVGKFEGVEEAMARIAGLTYQLEASRVMSAGAVDLGVKPSVVSAIAKYHMTEQGRVVINDAMDIHGGRGIQLGKRNYLGHNYMALPIAITVEGANILTRSLIVFGQGAVRCHPYVFPEMEAARDENVERGLRTFDDLLFRHIGYGISNFVRTTTMGLTTGRFLSSPVTGPIAPYYKQLTRMSTALALTADMAMGLLGGDLKRKELLSARLGDVLSHLYLASAALKYWEDNGRPEEDLPYLKWVLEYNLNAIQVAFDGFFRNFPIKLVGKVLQKAVFPYGISYQKPSDALGQKLSRHMMEQSELRDRLTSEMFIGDENHPAYLIEQAMTKMIATETIDAKLQRAIKKGVVSGLSFEERLGNAIANEVLSANEAEQLRDYEAARWDAIQTDDFEHEYLVGQASIGDGVLKQAA